MNKIMENEEKAALLSIKLEGEIGTSTHSRQSIEESFVEMAKWKDKIFNEERKELLGLVKLIPINERNQTIIEDLKLMLE